MLVAISKLDGLNVALFHMEQSPPGPWEWRMKVEGGEWRDPVRAIGRYFQADLVHATRAIDMQWRMVGGDPWIPAVPYEFGEAKCEFVVKASLPYLHASGEKFVVCGMVNGFSSVWALDMPARLIAGDREEIFRVSGVAEQMGLGQVLEYPGDFKCSGNGFSVINASASQAALLPVPRCEIGVSPHRGGGWAVKTGALPDHEIEELKREIASWR